MITTWQIMRLVKFDTQILLSGIKHRFVTIEKSIAYILVIFEVSSDTSRKIVVERRNHLR